MMHHMYHRTDSMLVPSQWETSLQCNAVSEWLGANLESALVLYHRLQSSQPIIFAMAQSNAVDRSHYIDVMMTTMASQITSLTVVYSIVYSDADQRKHQSSASLASVWGIHRDRWIHCRKGQLREKCFHLMTSSCNANKTGNVKGQLEF